MNPSFLGPFVAICIFMLTQLGVAVAWGSRLTQRLNDLERRVSDLEADVNAMGKFESRLVRIETLLEDLVQRVRSIK